MPFRVASFVPHCLALLLVFAGWIVPAAATPVTVNISGQTANFLYGPWAPNADIDISFTYEGGVPKDSGSSIANFFDAADNFSMTVDGFGTYTGGDGRLSQNYPSSVDNFEVTFRNGVYGNISGPVVGGYEILEFFARFQGPLGTIFDDRDVLNTGFEQADMTLTSFQMRFIPVGGGSQIQANLNNLTVSYTAESTVVSEPSGLAVIVAGLIAMILRRRFS